ncbi:MAG: nucleotidyl transferase AbiEii/AbiGii toxin family protein, partial [Actinokineospora sp.]
MSRPTRQTPGGRAYLDLQNRARREKRTTQELLTLYVLERWLARLAASPHANTFVLKGGLLLAVFDARRSTADADLLARHLANDQDTITNRVKDIAQVVLAEDDGVEYLAETTIADTIREDTDHTGVRVAMNCSVSTAAVKLRLDINVGDPVTPAPQLIELPSQRPDIPAVSLLGYPLETVLAEKASTAIAL